jgi:hypothetical protein
VGADNSTYFAGETDSTDLPVVSAHQATNAGSFDAFVTKLNPAGAVIYTTYLGGSGGEYAWGIAVDSAGAAYVVGQTTSSNFPTAGALQGALHGAQDAFVTKLSASGSTLSYSTYFGGTGTEIGNAIAVNAAGEAHIVGSTGSTDLPLQNAAQGAAGSNADAFVAKLNAAGSALVYSTYLGGASYDGGVGIAVDEAGGAYAVGGTNSTDFPAKGAYQSTQKGGSDIFLTKYSAAGAVTFSTLYGGTLQDNVFAVAVDKSGAVVVSGQTKSTDLPTKNPLQAAYAGGMYDAYIAKFDATGSSLLFATYLGGADMDGALHVAIDSTGAIVVGGTTRSTDFPVQSPLQAYGGAGDAFVTKITSNGARFVYSTYFGGSGSEQGLGLAIGPGNSAILVGDTYSANLPTKSAFQTTYKGSDDAFIVKIGDALTITPAAAILSPLDKIQLAANGGSGLGYTWTVKINVSGGSVDNTGHYVAGATRAPMSSR